MNRYPPVLTDVLDAPCGSILVLNDDRRIPLNLSRAVLQNYLATHGFPSLTDICRLRNASVFHLPVRMTEDEWSAISATLRTSSSAAELLQFPDVCDGLKLSYAEILDVPYRLYGGVGEASYRNGPTLYLTHPFDFHPDDIRRLPWYYGLLSSRGGHEFNNLVNIRTLVNIKEETVETESIVNFNHFVEAEPWSPATPEITNATFNQVLAQHNAVAVHFWAVWNEVDLMMDESIQAISPEFDERLHFVSCNIDLDENRELYEVWGRKRTLSGCLCRWSPA